MSLQDKQHRYLASQFQRVCHWFKLDPPLNLEKSNQHEAESEPTHWKHTIHVTGPLSSPVTIMASIPHFFLNQYPSSPHFMPRDLLFNWKHSSINVTHAYFPVFLLKLLDLKPIKISHTKTCAYSLVWCYWNYHIIFFSLII